MVAAGGKIPFSSFDREAPFRTYWSRLPHWRQQGCTNFATFRLADALPRSAVEALKREHDAFLHGHGLDPEDPNFKALYVKTLDVKARARFEREQATRLNRFLDAGHGACLLARADCARAFRDCLLKFDGDRLHVGDFVIMPNHVHVLMTPMHDEALEDLLQHLKAAATRKINALTESPGQKLCQRSSFDHIVRDSEHLRKFQCYIADNPKKAGIEVLDECYQTREYEL